MRKKRTFNTQSVGLYSGITTPENILPLFSKVKDTISMTIRPPVGRQNLEKLLHM